MNTATLDTLTAPTASLSLNSQKITNLATPTLTTDATTKSYVDTIGTNLTTFTSKFRNCTVTTGFFTTSLTDVACDGFTNPSFIVSCSKNQISASGNSL